MADQRHDSGIDRPQALITGVTSGIGRAASTEEIAETIAFLASPRSSYVTGAVLAVDGGRAAV